MPKKVRSRPAHVPLMQLSPARLALSCWSSLHWIYFSLLKKMSFLCSVLHTTTLEFGFSTLLPFLLFLCPPHFFPFSFTPPASSPLIILLVLVGSIFLTDCFKMSHATFLLRNKNKYHRKDVKRKNLSERLGES